MSKDSSDCKKVSKKELSSDVEVKKVDNPVAETTLVVKDLEEIEALSRDAENDMDKYMGLCGDLRNHILLLGSEEQIPPSKLNDMKREICLSFIMMKKLNRLEKYRLKNARSTLHAKKLKVDTFNLQLQNLRYEIYHLKKEVVKCLQFRSKDEDIDLINEESFFNEAPESISRPEVTKNDAHQLKLARLEWELKQRKEQADLCQKVEGENESVAKDINAKRNQLDNLAPLLKKILSEAKPLQENLSYPECPSREKYKLAPLLPEPLYCLFVQIDAFRQACCPSIEVKICGDENEAQRFNKTLSEEIQQNQDSDSENEETTESNSKTRGSSSKKSSSSKHRHSKSRLSEATSVKTVVDKAEEKRQKLCLTHPLTVTLSLKSKSSPTTSSNTSLTFIYYVNLHVVCVKVNKLTISMPKTADNGFEILAQLFPEDTISATIPPNISNFYLLKQNDVVFNPLEFGYPYVWVQRLAGLEFMKTQNKSSEASSSKLSCDVSVSQACVPVIIKRLRKRFQNIQELFSILVQLENNQLIEPHHCSLVSWQSISWSQFKSCECTKDHIQNQFITSDWLCYKAILSRGPAKMTAYIGIHHDYPIIPPIFAVQVDIINKTSPVKHAGNDPAIRDLEKELNVHWKDISNTHSSQSILRAQIESLASSFDIYLECQNSKDFPRKMNFVKVTRGRTRAHPYQCVSKSESLFSQR